MKEILRIKNGDNVLLTAQNISGQDITFLVPDWYKIPATDNTFSEYAASTGGNWSNLDREQSRQYSVTLRVPRATLAMRRSVRNNLVIIARVRPLTIELTTYEGNDVIVESFNDSRVNDEIVETAHGHGYYDYSVPLLNRTPFKSQTINNGTAQDVL